MSQQREFQPGDIVHHFKRENVDPATTRYLYRILVTAEHTETREQLMIYQALYDDSRLFARPLVMFMSEVDREKYPDVKQTYRFEPATPEEVALVTAVAAHI